MKRTYWKIGLILLVLALCISEGSRTLVRAREIDQLELVTSLGIDVSPDEPGLLDVMALGSESGGDRPVTMQTEQQTLAQAVNELRVLPHDKLFFGHTEQLILGEEAAKQDLGQHLDFIARDISMRLDVEIYVAKHGKASDLIQAATDQMQSTFDYLKSAEEDMLILPVSYPFSGWEVLQQLLATDGCALVSAVTMESQKKPVENSQKEQKGNDQSNQEKEKQKQIGGIAGSGQGSAMGAVQDENSIFIQVPKLDGYAVFRDYKLVDYITAEDAAGVNLILNKLHDDIVVVDAPGGGTVALAVTRGKTGIRPQFEKGKLQKVICSLSISADINEVRGARQITQPVVVKHLEEQLRMREVERVEKTISKAQQLRAYYLGIGKKIECAAPAQWRKIKDQWKTLFPIVPFQVEAEVKIDQTYDLNCPVERATAAERKTQ